MTVYLDVLSLTRISALWLMPNRMLVMVVTLYSRDGETHYRKVFVSIYLRLLSTFDGYIYLGSSAMNDDRLGDVRFLDFPS